VDLGSIADVSKRHVASIFRIGDGGSMYIHQHCPSQHGVKKVNPHGLEVIGEEQIMIFCT
jgi:hypothetical protein